jgi:phage-related protein
VTTPPYTLEFYEDEHGHEPVLDWLRGLTPSKRRAIGVAMFEILQYEGPHVVGTNFGKGLGGGVFEFRLDQVLALAGIRVNLDLPAVHDPVRFRRALTSVSASRLR